MVNYADRAAVIAYAKRLGRGMTVYKHPQRANFNITHTSRTDLFWPSWVVFQS